MRVCIVLKKKKKAGQDRTGDIEHSSHMTPIQGCRMTYCTYNYEYHPDDTFDYDFDFITPYFG